MGGLKVVAFEEKERHGLSVDRKQLINKINFLHFKKNNIILCFRHRTFGKVETVSVAPLPLKGEILQCRWLEKGIPINMESYQFINLLVPDGRDVYSVGARILGINGDGIKISLPETCLKTRNRSSRRFSSHGRIDVTLMQNGTSFSGQLVDFNTDAFQIRISESRNRLLKWLNPKEEVFLFLSRDKENYFSGACRIIRDQFDHRSGKLVLARIGEGGRKFRPKSYRGSRVSLTPEPVVTYLHPLTGRRVSLRLIDLSITGMALQDPSNEGGLFPGLVLPEVRITFAGAFRVPCQAQVIYRCGEDDQSRRFGIAITDISKSAQDQLMAVVHQAGDANCFVSTQIEPEALWDFFFRTGFIYPEKYISLQNSNGNFIRTYERLYSNQLPFSRHFFYQKDDQIAAHMGMLKFYPAGWMIHHHAADNKLSNRGGLIVLEKVSQALAESFNNSPGKTSYAVSYFRPENKFPDRVFGGFYRSLQTPRICSVDSCDYLHVNVDSRSELPGGWEISEAKDCDFRELEAFYEYSSEGGLTLEALGLSETLRHEDSEISAEYNAHGLERTRSFQVLKKHGQLKAFFLLSRSDPGLNLSDLTNCIQVFFLDTRDITKDILNVAITNFSDFFVESTVPLLGFPHGAVEDLGYVREKIYNLWVLDMDHADRFLEFCNRFFRIARRSRSQAALCDEAL